MLRISLLELIVSLRPFVPESRSISCVCLKVTFFCVIVSLTTDLTWWLGRSRFSLFLIVCFDCVGINGNLVVGVRICLTIAIVVVNNGIIFAVLGLVLLSFELPALVSILTWFFAVVAS